MLEGDTVIGEEEERKARFRSLYDRNVQKLSLLFSGLPPSDQESSMTDAAVRSQAPETKVEPPASQSKRPGMRIVEEDDYDDDDGDTDPMDLDPSPLKGKGSLSRVSTQTLHPLPSKHLPSNGRLRKPSSVHSDPPKSLQDPRKQLEMSKQAQELAAKQSLDTMFYTLENDRDAMLDQEKVLEADAQVEADMSRTNGTTEPEQEHQKLSNANLGASSLALKNLIQRIDKKRKLVEASDTELRHLMSEVRKNRSKWFSEDKVNQEELYEATDKVISELKAHDQIIPFLNKVNKRDAPGYYDVVKHPMDLGTMQKKLKNLQYRSKKEVADDLALIWSNCLRFNQDASHHLRKKAIAMRAVSEKLVPLIPDLVVRDRAEVEAEERRQHAADMNLEESDEEPILSMRGRKAPSKVATKGTRKSMKTKPQLPADIDPQQTPAVDSSQPQMNGRTGSDPLDELEPISLQPSQKIPANGHFPVHGSDLLDPDESRASIQGIGAVISTHEEPEPEDLEHRTWRIVTKKDRARVAMERHRLFAGDQINPEEPALLRTRASMRRWTKRHYPRTNGEVGDEGAEGEGAGTGATLAEGLEDEDSQENQVLPDYYNVQSVIPQVPKLLRWTLSPNGEIELPEQYVKLAPTKQFSAPGGSLQTRIEANMKQMQDTRKLVSKITMIKQMQIQQQSYANQFHKYNPQTFLDEDVPPQVTISKGPILASNVARAALQRSVGKIFYHAGFEEFHPSAIESVTEIAIGYFGRLCKTLLAYREGLPRSTTGDEFVGTDADDPAVVSTVAQRTLPPSYQPRFTEEQAILHALHENTVTMKVLGSYLGDDMDRTATKLQTMHERMKAHLANLLRPALAPEAGVDGEGAFNDGSEEFVSGDFAEELGEDFFGFRELGLDREFGMQGLGVPLHLLHSRIRRQYHAAHAGALDGALDGAVGRSVFDLAEPLPWAKVDGRVIGQQIGLVRGWFQTKMMTRVGEVRTKAEKEGREWTAAEEADLVLVEDDELPPKQRFPKPRLPPTGKISSPRKRPIKEQQAGKRKKMKMNDGAVAAAAAAAAAAKHGGANGMGVAGSIGSKANGLAKGAGKLHANTVEFNNHNTLPTQGSLDGTDDLAPTPGSRSPDVRRALLSTAGPTAIPHLPPPTRPQPSHPLGSPVKNKSGPAAATPGELAGVQIPPGPLPHQQQVTAARLVPPAGH